MHIRQPILRAIKKQGDDIDRVIRLGTISSDYTLRAGGLEVDIQPLIEKYRERYAEWIANNISDGVFNGFKGIKSVILVGGGAYLIEDHMQEWYSGKILDCKKHDQTKRIAPEDMNAVGGLRFAICE